MGSGEILGLLLSTGTAAMLWAVVQSWRALRMGARADEKDQVDEAEDSRRKAIAERDIEMNVSSYWRTRAGVLEYLLASKGVDLPTFPDPPESVSVLTTAPYRSTPTTEHASPVPMPEMPQVKENE